MPRTLRACSRSILPNPRAAVRERSSVLPNPRAGVAERAEKSWKTVRSRDRRRRFSSDKDLVTPNERKWRCRKGNSVSDAFPQTRFFSSSSCLSKRLERSNSTSVCVVSLVRSGEAQRDAERKKSTHSYTHTHTQMQRVGWSVWKQAQKSLDPARGCTFVANGISLQSWPRASSNSTWVCRPFSSSSDGQFCNLNSLIFSSLSLSFGSHLYRFSRDS
jgi:hypothetical protein